MWLHILTDNKVHTQSDGNMLIKNLSPIFHQLSSTLVLNEHILLVCEIQQETTPVVINGFMIRQSIRPAFLISTSHLRNSVISNQSKDQA